ncbi:MAG: hypothetical protein DCC67_18390 [Planctomycetota bacterium]|nr:MAG: hypothetical protein DCC67_18390 [Planctomycetota bacterium]
MEQLLGALLTRVLLDVSLAFAAFFLGFFTAFFYYRHVLRRPAVKRPAAAPTEAAGGEHAPPVAVANEIARADMAAQQLRDLAQHVASDVGAHNTLVEGIADQLGSLTQAGGSDTVLIMQAVAKIVDANKKLASRLEDAEQKIQAQAEEIRTQQFEARTDALTKLANRRAFDGFLMECVDKHRRTRRPFSLVLLDVDHFKRFNDVHGHQAGDEVLRSVGKTLTRTVSSGDLACRYGGEELAVVLASASADEAKIAAERIRRAIETLAVTYEGEVLHVTASIGMATHSADEEPARLTRRADEAVYAAKKDGRNCTYWHNGDHCVRVTPTATEALGRALPAIAGGQAEGRAGVVSRAAFSDELGRRIAESHRFGYPLTLLCFRVKDFAKLQLTYGNAIGAMLMDALAAFIQSALREMDLLGKLDDSELIVLLSGCTDSAARIVGQRVKTSISLCPIPLGSRQIRLELDMGAATVQPDDNAAAAIASARGDMEAAARAENPEQPAAELATV